MDKNFLQDKLKYIENKIEELNKIKEEFLEFRKLYDLKYRRNNINTKKIINEFYTKSLSDLNNKERILKNEREEFIKDQGKKRLKLKELQLKFETKKEKDISAIEIIFQEKSKGFPWLANAIADYFSIRMKVLHSF